MVLGLLTERIEVRRRSRTPDGYGGFTEVESSLGVFWGRVGLAGWQARQVLSEQLGSQTPYQVTLLSRGLSGLESGDVLVAQKVGRLKVVNVSRFGDISLVIAVEE